MSHRLAEFFGRRPAVAGGDGDPLRGAVVLDDDRGVIDGDIVHALVEVADGIAAGVHQLLHQLAGLGDRVGRLFDTACLGVAPRGGEAFRVGWPQRPDVEAANALAARCQRRLGARDAAVFADGALILGSELFPKLSAPRTARDHPRGDGDDSGDDHDDDDDTRVAHIGLLAACGHHDCARFRATID